MAKLPKRNFELREITTNPDYGLHLDSQDIEFWLGWTAFPKKYMKDITGVVVHTYEGDVIHMYVTESSYPYSIYAEYHSLPFYRPRSWRVKKLPEYWKDSIYQNLQ